MQISSSSYIHGAVHTFKHCFFPYSELGSDAIQKVLMLSVGVDLIGQCYSMLSVGVDLIGQCCLMLSVRRGFDWSMLFGICSTLRTFRRYDAGNLCFKMKARGFHS